MIARITLAFSIVDMAFAVAVVTDLKESIVVITNEPMSPINEMISPASPPMVVPTLESSLHNLLTCDATSFSD